MLLPLDSMYGHTHKTTNQTKPKMCEQHKTLCYEYKNTTSLEKQMFAM